MGKVIELDVLIAMQEELRQSNKKIVLCHGVFDLLHIGHIRYLSESKKHGDILVVTVTPDRYVDKGNDRPAFPEKLRAEALASLECTDYVALNKWPTAKETLKNLKPDFYAKGAEFLNVECDITGKIQEEAEVAASLGIKMVFIEDIVFSSSHLLNKYMSSFPPELEEYLELYRRRYSLETTLEALNRLRELRVLVVGDTILDEYVYCKVLGLSSKDPAIALHHQAEELFAGGAIAVANHVANFAKSVSLYTFMGDDGYESFVREHCHSNIDLTLEYFSGCTTRKRRYIDENSLAKLYEIYYMKDVSPDATVSTKRARHLQETVKNFDLVLVPDFGHGAITKDMVNVLCNHAPFIAVNTQANAGNRGFHTIHKYPRADFISIAEHELRLACASKEGDIGSMMLGLHRKLDASMLMVTCGQYGTSTFGKQGLTKTPSIPAKVVDRVGAGDALLAVTSMLACQGCPQEIVGLLGNICGAIAVGLVGNSSSLKPVDVIKHCTALLK